jgi:hypothetical protein
VLANRAGEHYLSPFYAVRICSREAKRKKSRKFAQWKTVFNDCNDKYSPHRASCKIESNCTCDLIFRYLGSSDIMNNGNNWSIRRFSTDSYTLTYTMIVWFQQCQGHYSLLTGFKFLIRPLYKSTIWIQLAIFRKSKDLAISLQFHANLINK